MKKIKEKISNIFKKNPRISILSSIKEKISNISKINPLILILSSILVVLIVFWVYFYFKIPSLNPESIDFPIQELRYNFVSTVIGSIVGILGAFLTIFIQLEAEKDRELENKKAYLILNDTTIKECNIDLKNYLDNRKNDLFLTVTNAGKTPIFKLKSEFKVLNLDQLSKNYKSLNEYWSEANINHSISVEDAVSIDENREKEKVLRITSKESNKKVFPITNLSTNYEAVLLPEKIAKINLPDYYFLMYILDLNNFLESNFESNKKEKVDIPNIKLYPKLELVVTYEDYLHQEHEETKLINIGMLGVYDSSTPIQTDDIDILLSLKDGKNN